MLGAVLEGEEGSEAPRGMHVVGEEEEREQTLPLDRDMVEVEGVEEEEAAVGAVFPQS